MMPASVRPALWALYAFNYEIAKVRETVSDPTLGLIRLQWWRDALEGIYAGKEAPAHEVARALGEAIVAYDLSSSEFENLLTARERDLDDAPMESLQALGHYAAQTNAPLLRLAVKVCGETPGEAETIGAAYGLAGILRSVPFLARQGRCLLPVDVNDPTALADTVRDVCGYAENLLKHKPANKMECVTARQARLWLGHIRALRYDVRDSRLILPPPFYALRLWLAR
jgi:phytoene/squalene synthetase